MSLIILFRLAMQSLLKNRTRAMLTMLGIVIGVAAVIVMVAVGYGARSRIREQIGNLGTNMIVITPGASTTGGVSQGAQAFATLTIAGAEKIRDRAQTLVAVSPVIALRSRVIAAGGNWRTSVHGVDPDYQAIRDWQTDSGSFFGPEDVRGARSVAVPGRTVADRTFPGSDPVGQEIQIAALGFQVTGVLSPKGQTATGSGSDVLVQFLVESVVMGALGGIVGLVVGFTGAKVLAHFTGWETAISPLVMIGAVGFSGAVGVFFGFYPARKAAALNPIEALRYE